MSLHDLRREYEERRRALIEQLQGNKHLDAATQHQIYGAIKEIENFLATIDAHQEAQQARGIDVDLSRERPRPFVERTQKVFHKVRSGTGRVFKQHIPNATRAIVAAPKRYFDRKREERRLRTEIEAELRARHAIQLGNQNQEFVVLEHPHQVLPAEEHTPVSHTAQELPSQDAAQAKITHKGAVRGTHAKRRKTVEKPARTKAQPSKHAGKSMHKTHRKHDHAHFKPSKKKKR